jgi:hypothetical protein
MKSIQVLLLLLSVLSIGAMEKHVEKEAVKKAIMPIKGHLSLDKEGNFANPEAVAQFLQQAVKEGRLPEQFRSVSKVKSMTKEAKIARFATVQLFSVTLQDGSSFILKEIGKDAAAEVERLEQARVVPCIAHSPSNKFHILFPAYYLSYKSGDKNHILALMEKAPGISLQALMEKFKTQDIDEATLALTTKAFYDLGTELALFYKQCGGLDRAITHNDLHAGNIFYFNDGKTRLSTIIDNERFANSIGNPNDISIDLGFLFVTSPFVLSWTDRDFFKSFNAKRWYSLIVPAFILGFLDTYPKNERITVFQRLSNFIKRFNSKIKDEDSAGVRKLILETMNYLEQAIVREHKSSLHIVAAKRSMAGLAPRLIGIFGTGETDVDGNMPLHEAAFFGNVTVLKALLDAKADAKKGNKKGETPLFKAQFKKSTDEKRFGEVIKLLKEAGA